jgi:glycosyltransferase involved in cell wall biosynthesis
MMPLRIAHVVNEPFGVQVANGVQHVVYCLARAQAESDRSVAVFSRDDRTSYVLRDGARSSEHRLSENIRPGHRRPLVQRLLSRYVERNLSEDVVAWQPDVVHFHSMHILRNVVLADSLCRAGIPYCVTPHGALFPIALERNRFRKLVVAMLVERHYLNGALFIHAVSPNEVEAVRRYGVSRPVVVVPNGLPPEAFVRPSRPEALYDAHPWLRDRRVFMFIGRLDPWQKGLDLLIEAFRAAGLHDAGLVLVGPDFRGSHRTLATLADRLGISSQLVFTGPVFGDDRANLLAAADVFVHPSRWEGLSLSVLAAAAAGKPCLITRAADPLGELERAQAAFVVEASVSSIAGGLSRAATLDSRELQMMGARARQVADAHFMWPAIAGRLVEAYQSALHPGQPSAVEV